MTTLSINLQAQGSAEEHSSSPASSSRLEADGWLKEIKVIQ